MASCLIERQVPCEQQRGREKKTNVRSVVSWTECLLPAVVNATTPRLRPQLHNRAALLLACIQWFLKICILAALHACIYRQQSSLVVVVKDMEQPIEQSEKGDYPHSDKNQPMPSSVLPILRAVFTSSQFSFMGVVPEVGSWLAEYINP
jgi:hypothetical protein